MKTGRNEPCPCGSGKKYKRCCIDNVSKLQAEVFDELEQTVAMNPNLSLDELNVVTQQRMLERNERPIADFCGLSPTQMSNWLHAPFNELVGVTISTPDDVSSSPVMCYLELILDEAIKQDGSFKATSKGNLPAKLVKQASDLLPKFAVAKYETLPSISAYIGSKEDDFNALHYTRILAEIAGIVVSKSGRYHVKKAALKQYQTDGVKAFALPLLEAATTQYNWGYFDGWEDEIELRAFWLFMLWRLQSHGSIDQLTEEVTTAFPDIAHQFPGDQYQTPQERLADCIESRFIECFLQFWGFITVDPKRFADGERLPRKADIQPLLQQVFQFAN